MSLNHQTFADSAVPYLRELLRINTVNPPGNEVEACHYIAAVLAEANIESRILEAAPSRGNLVARLKGDGRAPPLLLMAHLDVVPVEADYWSHAPFGGVEHEGFLYGRGALDTKELVAMELAAFIALKERRLPLARDVILMFNADEEAGGRAGAGWMVREHPDLIRAEYAINEGGGFGTTILGKRIYNIQTGEKGTARFILRARGKPGHGSMPHSDNAVLKLAHGLELLGNATLPIHIVPTAQLYVEGLAKTVGGQVGAVLHGLVNGKSSDRAFETLPLEPGLSNLLYAMMHNTATPTKLNAGGKINVIPSVAEAQVDGRILPGQTQDSFLRELRAVLDDSYEIEFHEHSSVGIEMDPQSPLLDTIARGLKRHDPEAHLLPELVVGATDARHVTKLGTRVYGFCPMFDQASEMERVHAHDERISIENIKFGTRVLYDVVSEFASRA